jgi:hypothetical protein
MESTVIMRFKEVLKMEKEKYILRILRMMGFQKTTDEPQKAQEGNLGKFKKYSRFKTTLWRESDSTVPRTK